MASVVASSRRQRAIPMILRTIPEDECLICPTYLDQILSGQHNAAGGDCESIDVTTNRTRIMTRLDPLERSTELDLIAHAHARAMAGARTVFHSVSNIDQLRAKLGSPDVGENIQRGKCIYEMHNDTMSSPDSINRKNLMSDNFAEMGMGTALGADNFIYLVQVFRSKNGYMQ